MRLAPWPHLVLDSFLEESCLAAVLEEIKSRHHEFEIDYRGKGRIEFSLLHSPTLWRALYSATTISVLSDAFGCKLRFNKGNLLQLRRMNGDTPSFPLHNDYTEGMDTVVSFLYLSPGWHPDFGGRLLLNSSERQDDVAASIEPVKNRLVAFRTLGDYWHSVEKVCNWERISALAVWDVVNDQAG